MRRTRGSADGYWSGHKYGLDPGETRVFDSWLPEGTGVLASYWMNHGVWGWTVGGVIDLNQLVKHVWCVFICAYLCVAAGTLRAPGHKLSVQGWLLVGPIPNIL